MMWTDGQVRRALREPDDLDRASRGFDLMSCVVLALIALCFMLAVLVPYDQSEVLRHRCDPHGGIYRSAVDGGQIIAVTCRDGEQFSQ